MAAQFQSGFVNIFGPPNAGKSTLLNALLGEQLAITSHKVQTTRHRIIGIVTEPNYQIIFSDTPGIIPDPKYKLHQKMMLQVKSALEDADLALLLADISKPVEEFVSVIAGLKLKVPVLLLLNKLDLLKNEQQIKDKIAAFTLAFPQWKIMPISALKGKPLTDLVPEILHFLPEAPAYFPEENLTDRPTRFFVSEIIREQIYNLFQDEIPYHSAVIIQSFEEKTKVDVIKAEIIVSRDTQKMILLGKGGASIKELGIRSRKKMEEFLQRKVHLELYIKVRPKWRDNENYLREYGYGA